MIDLDVSFNLRVNNSKIVAPPPYPEPPGRIIAIDYGTVRIGIAISDPEQHFSSPYENYNRRNARLDAQYFQTLAEQERPVQFIVGLPLHLSGDESQKSLEVRRFGDWLHTLTGVPIAYVDERFSSVEAEQLMAQANFTKKKRKARLDMLAAQILLSNYLESLKNNPEPFAQKSLESLDD